MRSKLEQHTTVARLNITIRKNAVSHVQILALSSSLFFEETISVAEFFVDQHLWFDGFLIFVLKLKWSQFDNKVWKRFPISKDLFSFEGYIMREVTNKTFW